MATNNSVNTPLSGTTGTGNFVGSTSPAITTPKLGTMNDTAGDAALQFIPSAGGSWVTLQNTSSPQLQAAGSASNIILYLKSKGDAAVSFVTSAVTAYPIQIYSGTAGQHLTQFGFSNTAASRVVTFPDLTGTVALSGASQTVTFNGVTAGITATASSLNQSASSTTFTGTGVLSQQFITNSGSYNELAGYDFATSSGSTPYARIAAYKTGAGSIIKMGTSNNYGSGITNTAVTIDQSGIMTLSSALPVGSGGTGATSATAYAVLCGGTTSTGALQSVASVGTAGQVLTSNGAGALPSFQNAFNGPAFSAYAASSQSITANTLTLVTLGTELFDTNNNFASSRFTPTVAGYYQINGIVRGTGTTMTLLQSCIYKNGSAYNNVQINTNTPSYNTQACISEVIYLNGTTDYVELYGAVYCASGASFNYVDSAVTSHFNGCYLRGA